MKGGQKKLALFFFLIFVSMINEVRNAVLAFLNKNNYGYITPQDFNLYAKQAQLDVFEDMFYQYNYQINKENARQSGTGYADIKKGLEEVIDIFSQEVILISSPPTIGTTNVTNLYSLPADYYLINRINYRPNYITDFYTSITSGTPNAFRLNMTGTDTTSSVSPGDLVVNINSLVAGDTQAYAYVMSKLSAQQLSISKDIFTAVIPNGFGIWKNNYVVEIERVHQNRLAQLLSSNLTAPSFDFPVYVNNGNVINIYPVTTTQPVQTIQTVPAPSNNYGPLVTCQYIRYPRDPKWTYLNITGGEPVFDQSQADYQDFELPDDSFADLIVRILQYAGVGIREIDVANFATTQITTNNQEEA
jgi:hypothetical protein